MKLFHSFKTRPYNILGPITAILLIVFSISSFWANRPLQAATPPRPIPKAKPIPKPKPTPKPIPVPVTPSPVTPTPVSIKHTGIVTTVFWVGESGSDDNGDISNAQSAWDEQWETHYGGADSDTNRNGYLPAGFTPSENPFYFSLPYSDYTDSGARKATATNCANKADGSFKNYSWCKNNWIAITFGGKTVYAQWEDVGPYEEDDVAYVFGTALPKNKVDDKSGLDVSPAIRDYLKLTGVDKTDWTFVAAANVPAGPWKNIITTTKGDGN